MNRLFKAFLILLFGSIIDPDCWGQPVYPPATQAEADAGVLTSKFISPATLASWSGMTSPTGGVSSGTVTNIVNGLVTAGAKATNVGVGGTVFLDPAFGNDATAQRTNMSRPYLAPSNAVSAILSGDTLWVRSGTGLVNTKTNFAEFPNINSSGGLAITNRRNFRITGEPGATWAMSSRLSIGTTSSAPMLVIANCTNFIIENMTFVGIRTTNYASQDFAILLDRCGSWTIRNCVFSNWNNQGITDGGLADGLQLTVNQNCVIKDSYFYNIGTTNIANLGSDGAAISVNASNFVVDNNLFVHCYRELEFYRNGDVRNWRFSNNRSFDNYGQVLVLEATNNLSDGLVYNNRAYGYSTTLPFNVTEAEFCQTHGMSNVTFSQNFINGMSGIIWGAVGMGGLFAMRDVSIINNEFEDSLYRAILIRQDPSHTGGVVERLVIRGNKFRNNYYEALSVTGNNTVIDDNEIIDCGTVLDVTGAMAVGSFSSAFATNSTNIVITGNKIWSSNPAQYAGAKGIVIYPQCFGTIVANNYVDTNTYASRIVDGGTGTRTMSINIVEPLSLLRSDAWGDVRKAVIGSGIGWDGTNLTSTGGSGTPGGSDRSIQYYTNGAFGGDTALQYKYPVGGGSPTSGKIQINLAGITNTMDAHGFGTDSSDDVWFITGGLPRWYILSSGHLVPAFSNVNNVGSFLFPVKTNFMVGFFMTTDARKNKQLRSVDSGGVGVWSPTASGGNGNTAGANDPAEGAIQFARTNVTDGFMMNDSTNEFVYNYQTRTLTVPIINVQTQNVNVLIVTNGIGAPGSNGQILYNGTNIITASPQNTLDEFGVMTVSSLISPSVLLQDQVSYGMTNIFVGAANSNQTVLLGRTANMMLSNSVTFTNFSTLASTRNATYLALIRVVASTNVNVNWGLGIGWDAGRVTTNANNPIWPVLTNGQMYVASWTGFGTNRILRLSLEQ